MLTSMGDVMREAYSRGWITTRDGNISIKRGNKFYITPSGIRKNIIYPETIIKLNIKDNKLIVPKNTKASIELDMHRLIQLNDKKTKAVVHLHPTYTIALMHKLSRNILYGKKDLMEVCECFPEIYRYTKVAPTVKFHPPGSDKLANCVKNNLTLNGEIGYDIVGMQGHGVTAVADNPWDAFEHIERLEHISKIYLASGVL